MSWLQLIGRRGIAVLLTLALALLVAPAPPVLADPEPLPGYSVDDPIHGPPVAYNYPSANALASLPEPSAAALANIDLTQLAEWGTEQNLKQNWRLYLRDRAPYTKNPLTWAKYRARYISLYNSNHIGVTFEQIAKGEAYFDNTTGQWRLNQKLPGNDVNRRPDALNDPNLWAEGRNWLWDFKTGAISKDQLRDFLRYCYKNNLHAGILHDQRPPAKTTRDIKAVDKEIAKEFGVEPRGVEQRFLNIAPQAEPPGTGVLASGGQRPTDGGAEQTTDQSPDSPEDAVEYEWVAQSLQAEQQLPASQQAPARQPAPQAPAQQPAPAQPAPAQPAPAQPAPAQQVPVQAAPAQQVPVQAAPRPAPAQQAPVAAGPQAPGVPALPNLGPTPPWLVSGPIAAANAWATAVARALGAGAGVAANAAGGVIGAGVAAAAGAAGGAASGVAGAAGGAASALPSLVGGVDFSTLELRYISDADVSGTGVRYAFAANTQPGDAPSFGGRANAYQASDSFFVWMALPPQAFTVNLNPNEPDRIIDAQFGRTDAGRILLEADYTMKRATAHLIDPATPDGRAFDEALQGGQKCFSAQRKWIIPLPASVSQQGDSMYILDAPLDVKLEILGDDLKPGIGCHGQDVEATRHNDDLYRTTILPKVVDEVNHAPEYADLRRVYASRVAAEWYRQRSANKQTAYSSIINSGNIDAWTSQEPWDPREVFARYRKSFYEGDATYTWQAHDGMNWKLTIGGVDFTNIPMVNVTPADFTKAHPTLPATANDSLFGPRFENSGQQVWLGGLTSLQPLSLVWKGDPGLYAPLPKSLFGTSLSPIMYAVITLPLAAWVGVGGALWWRRRRAASFVGRR
jgi:hypothetical protein